MLSDTFLMIGSYLFDAALNARQSLAERSVKNKEGIATRYFLINVI